MRNGSETMEQHGRELNNQDKSEEEHEHQTNRFQLKIFFCYMYLDGSINTILSLNCHGAFVNECTNFKRIYE